MKTCNVLYILLFGILMNSPALAQQGMQVKFPVMPTGFYASVEFSNDGKLILFSEHQRTFLTDAFSYRTIADFKNTNESSFSRDSHYLLMRYDNQVNVWEISTQSIKFTFTAPGKSTIHRAVLTPDSKYLVMIVGSATWPIELNLVTIGIQTGEQLHATKINQSYPNLIPGSKSAVVALYDFSGRASIYDVAAGRELFQIGNETDTIQSIRFSPDDRQLVIAFTDRTIRTFDAKSGKQQKVISGHAGTVTSASFSHDGKMIVSSSTDHTIKIWNTASGKMVKEFKEDGPVYRASFSGKDNFILASMEYNWLNIRNVITGKKHNPEFLEMAKYAGEQQISPDEQLYYASSQIIRLDNAETMYTFKQEVEPIKTTAVSADGRYVATLRGYDNVSIWDLRVGGLVSDIHMPDTSRFQMFVGDLAFLDNENLVIGWTNGDLWKWDIGKAKAALFGNIRGGMQQLKINAAAKRLVVMSDSVITAFSMPALTKVFSFKEDSFRISPFIPLVYSPDNSLIAVNGASNNKLFILKASDGVLMQAIHKTNWGGKPVISPDNKKLVMLYNEPVSFIYDIQTGKETAKMRHVWSSDQKSDTFLEEWAEINDSSTYIMAFGIAKYGDQQTYLQRWDLNTGKKLMSVPFEPFGEIYETPATFVSQRKDSVTLLHHENLQRLRSVPGQKVIIDSVNNRVVVQNEFSVDLYSNTLEKIATIASFDNAGGIIVDSANYYKADRGAISKIYFQQGLNIIAVSQLDLVLNRPDKVLRSLGSADTVLLKSYKSAFDKRLKRLDLTEQQLEKMVSIPKAEVVNRNSIPAQQLTPKLTLKVKAFDSTSVLDHYNVWINDVPLYGSAGVSIAKKHSQQFEENINVELSKGANRIEFAVVNTAGKESFRQPLNVFMGTRRTLEETHGYQSYDPNAPKEGTVYFIGIGIDHFKDSTYNLQWSVKDIRDLANKFATKNFGWNTVIDTLFNEQVTVSNIMALRKKLLNTTVNDKVIFSYSGHGLLNDKMEYFLSTYDVNFLQPDRNGLAYTSLESLFDAIPARKKLVLIDACHSGEVDKDDIVKIQAAKPSLDSLGTKTKSTIRITSNKTIGMANSFEVMQQLFINMNQGTGATIISAAGGMQYAQERGDLKNGVFTYSVLEAMQQNDRLTVSQLKKVISARVTQLTDGLQKPTSRTETNNYDWDVW